MSDSDSAKEPSVISPAVIPPESDSDSDFRSPKKRSEGKQNSGGAVPADSPAEEHRFDEEDITAFVGQCIEALNLEPLFDGTLLPKGAPLRADTPDMVAEYLAVEHLTGRDLLDQIVLISHNAEYGWRTNVVEAALRQVLRRMRTARFNTVMMPLVSRVEEGTLDEAVCNSEWTRLSQLFEMPAALAVAVFKHFIWQVKQKTLGLPVAHHLMPIIFSAIQGSGKTTFVRKLISPLRELASADALLSDFADRRSGDIYRFPVVVIDDIEQITKAAVPLLKSLMTSERINRRRLHTSQSTNTHQKATLIGTANASVHELVEDATGHRRFVMLPFRNGDVAKGGDGVVWEIVSSLNYESLWLSVDPYSPSPIKAYLSDLHAYQNRGRPIPSLLRWLHQLDLQSEAIKRISVRTGVRADGLHELYTIQTGNRLSRQKFADEMLVHMSDPGAPFYEKQKLEVGVVYRLKPQVGALQPHSLVPTTGGSDVPSSEPSDPSGSSASSGSSVPRSGLTTRPNEPT